MKNVLFTMPGKIGDAFMQWPVAFHWAREQKQKINVGVDSRMLKHVAPLFGVQPCVDKTYLLDGIEHYMCGGQPFDFQMPPTAYKSWDEVFHLGHRGPPEKQLTLDVLDYIGFDVDRTRLANDRTVFGSRIAKPKNRLLLHGMRYVQFQQILPFFWKALFESRELLEKEFEEIVFIGTRSDRMLADACGYKSFEDGGDFVKLVDYMQDSRLVLGCGSSMIALAGALKVPSIRIHDNAGAAEGHLPPETFSNLGPHQWNLAEGTDYKETIAECLNHINTSTVSNAPSPNLESIAESRSSG